MRRRLGWIRIVAGALLLFTLVFQIVDLQVGGSLVPNEYFSFFTVQSTMLNIALLVVSGVWAVRHPSDPRLLASASMAIVPYAIITFAVYNVMLRGLPAEKYLGMDWHNEVVHVIAPVFLAVEWFVLRLWDRGRPRLSFRALGIAIAFPLAWIAFTMIRGAVTGYYPYPFLQPASGVASVVIWIVGLTAGILLLAAGAVAVTRVQRRYAEVP